MTASTRAGVAIAAAAIVLLAGCSSDPDTAPTRETSTSGTSGTVAPDGTAPDSTAVDTLMERGLQQVTEEDYDGATGTFESILALDPENVHATYNLGFIAQRQGQDARAIDRYAATIQLDDTFAPALYNLAILTEASDLDAAAAFYRRVLVLEPDDAATMTRLGHLLKHEGETTEGQRLIDRGIELDPAMKDVPAPVYASP